MKVYIVLIIIVLTGSINSSSGQPKSEINMKSESKQHNPLICDPEEGICEIPGHSGSFGNVIPASQSLLKVIYFTDPICSSCWGIEPQLRKLKLEYGNMLDIEYRMGGLLPDWSYNSGGISKPSDVAHHWDEVSVYYDMPIDGDVWLEDPLHSSFPPSIAFKAAEMQDKTKAILFLREIREMVFLEKKNISKWEHISAAAVAVGLDTIKLKDDYEGKAKSLFEEDLKLARELGVRGFPTMIFLNKGNKKEIVYGSRPYGSFEAAVLELEPQAKKATYSTKPEDLFYKFSSLTAKEFSVLSGLSRIDSEKILDQYVEKGFVEKLTIKNGSIWKIK